jgi:hypothetical protein
MELFLLCYYEDMEKLPGGSEYNSGYTPEEEAELIDEWLNKPQYKTPEIPKEEKRECGPDIAELETSFAKFEEEFDINELHAVTNPTPREFPKNSLRDAANERLKAMTINKKLRLLEETTDITADKLAELKAKSKRLADAVGVISKQPSGEYIIEHR